MKIRNLLLACACALATSAMAQSTFPITLTPADGLPEQTTDAAKAFNGWTSPTFTFAEPVSSFRMTVTHTSPQDAFNTSANGSRGYVFFTLGEFYLYDGNGNKVELTAENFSSNCVESAATGDGSGLAGLCDGDESTHFHGTYSTPEADCPKPIGGEHYIEVTFPEPMASFAIGFQKRSNNANIPSEIILTVGGVEANPFADYEFQLGEQIEVTDIKMGEMYVMCDNGNVSAYEGTFLYVAPNSTPGYKQSGQAAYHLRRTPNVDCIYVPVPAGSDEEGNEYFYLRNYFTGSYVRNVAGFQEQAYNIDEAAKLHFYEVEGVYYLMSNTNIVFSTNSQASFVGYQDWTETRRPTYFYKASIATKYLYNDLQAVITDATAQLAANKEKFAPVDDGETAALEEALAAAKAIAETATADEINSAKAALESAAATFLTIQVYLWVDEVYELLDTAEFGTEFGQYPVAQKKTLENLAQQLANDIDTRSFTDLTDIKGYIAKIQKILDDFYASKVIEFSEWPLHLVGENGAILFTKMGDLGNYIYTSPTFFLEEPVERIYITTVQTNTGDAGGGWPCTNWAHFELYDANGEKVDLYESNFSTNALETNGDGQGLAGICDYNEDGTPNLTTYLHTLYSSSQPETNEHYICVEFPEPMRVFNFELISRDNGRLIPIEMVIGPEPYHFVPDQTIDLFEQVLNAADIDPNKFYLLHGNINVVDKGSIGSGYYTSAFSTAEKPQNEGAVQFIPAENGTWMIYFPVQHYYLKQPYKWAGAETTENEAEAGKWFITESENLQNAFKIWVQGEDTKYVLQDWSGSMGYYTVAGEGFENDDTDGESDWTIFECGIPTWVVYTTQINKLSQLNTNDEYAMYGNLEVVSKGTEGSGFYRGKDVAGPRSTNFTLFKLEDGGNGTYKIHFIYDNVYLAAPTGWAGMTVTENADEAGCFTFIESENLSGAFKIYASGSWDKDGTNCPIAVLQDWGDYMGSYTIPSWDQDDKDGESDWTLFTTTDPSEIVLERDDYMGTYIYQWNNYWTPTELRTFDVILQADTDSDDGVILTQFDEYGDLKGTFDGVGQTINFPTKQIVRTTDQWYVTYMTTNDKDIEFKMDFINNEFVFLGQAGVQNVSLEEGGSNGGWHFLSSSWVKLIPQEIGGDVRVAPAKIDGTVLSTVYYNLNGQMMAAPTQGINIVKTIYDSGTVRVQKILVK